MNRLTDDKTAQALKEIIDKLEAGGFEVDMSNRRYVRLAEYERTRFEPSDIKCKCNQLVRVGEWSKQMLFDDGFGGVRVGYICSVCKQYVPYAGRYCGKCGARMDGGDE